VVGWFGWLLLVIERWISCLYLHLLIIWASSKRKAGTEMKAYKPKFTSTALQARRWSLVDQQGHSELRAGGVGKPNAKRLNGNARIRHLDTLRAQIDAGTYHVDSRALARKMLGIKSVRSMLNIRR
jgi:anti-sigma28 factor (negative regulator of flagellin synthesis)